MSLLLLWALLIAPIRQTAGNRPATMRCVCGKLVYDHEIPQKKSSAEHRYKRKSVHHAALVLYSLQNSGTCCEGLSPVASAETDRFALFEFKNVQPGSYWLAVPSRGPKAFTPISYEPLNIKGVRWSPSDYVFVLDDAGELNWEMIEVLD
jgi:hypothetical protein